jgi:hypothetical protein
LPVYPYVDLQIGGVRAGELKASFNANWITRGFALVPLMTPNVGEEKLESGFSSWG